MVRMWSNDGLAAWYVARLTTKSCRKKVNFDVFVDHILIYTYYQRGKKVTKTYQEWLGSHAAGKIIFICVHLSFNKQNFLQM